MNIAIFDSGIGGLSVLYQARRMLPEAHFLYYADEDHVPYGEKTREQILTYTARRQPPCGIAIPCPSSAWSRRSSWR